jgi:membrane protease YdiL (CAAX protease family)
LAAGLATLLMVGWTLGAKSEMTTQYSNDKRMHHPLLLALLTAASLYLAKLWRDDLRAAKAGRPQRAALPGATPASPLSVTIAIAGALVLVAVETAGEFALGISAEQSRMTWLFALYSIAAAPIIEELIFRGWIVVEHRGRALMWTAVVGASAGFALLHPFLWTWADNRIVFHNDTKAWFSTNAVFATSLWFYAARLGRWNPPRSLLPCFLAHSVRNIAVVAIKAASGFMGPPF